MDVTQALLPGAPSHNISLSCAFFLPSSSSIPVKLMHHHGNRLNSEAVWVKHHSSDIYYQPLRLYGLMMGNHQCCDLWVETRACVNVDCSDSGDINAPTQPHRVNAAWQEQFKGVMAAHFQLHVFGLGIYWSSLAWNLNSRWVWLLGYLHSVTSYRANSRKYSFKRHIKGSFKLHLKASFLLMKSTKLEQQVAIRGCPQWHHTEPSVGELTVELCTHSHLSVWLT